MPEFDDISPDEAEALKAHLASIRSNAKAEAKAKRAAEIKAQLKAAQEEAARLTAELGEMDVDLTGDEGGAADWRALDKLSSEERRELARKQAAEAGVAYSPLPGASFSGDIPDDLPRDDDPPSVWAAYEDRMAKANDLLEGCAIEGVMPTGHGRTARRAPEGQHEPGALSAARAGRSADEELGKDYQKGVRVIQHRFKHRARNGRTLVTDETLSSIRKGLPGMDEDY